MNASILYRFAATLGVFAGFLVSVSAATFTVSNTGDTGAGSLRQAITDALAGGTGPHDIQAGGVTGTISLQTALPVITNTNIRIHGPTSGTLTVTRGTGAFRIFTVTNSGGAASLTINRLTMTNGIATVDLEATAVGGGIGVKDSTLVLNYCTVSGCSAAGNGGGIMLGGTVASTGTVNFCTISGNTTAGAGGGISTSSGISGAHVLNMTHSTISGNSTTGASGGGLTFVFGTGNVQNCTISGNTSAANGGGVNVGSSGATFNATNCTIANNTAPTGVAGGIRSTGTGGSTVNLINTLVVGNTITGGAAEDTNWGTGTKSAKNSVVGVHAGTAYGTVTASQIGTSASPKVVNLGALANNGGPTQTHALLATTPELAINLGSNPDAIAVATDQRGVGYNRWAGGTVDIGAFETGTTAPTFTGVTPLGAPASAMNSNTLSFTVPPGTNRMLLVFAGHADSAGANFTGVTFGASAMTSAGFKSDTTTAVDSFWTLPLGTSTSATTGTITVTPPAGQEAAHGIIAMAFQNVHQTTPTSGFASTNNIGTGSNPSINVTSAAGDLVVDVLDVWTSSVVTPLVRTPGAGQGAVAQINAPITNPPSSYTGFACYSISLEPGATTTTMSWTNSFEAMILAGLNIKQAATSVAISSLNRVNPTTTNLATVNWTLTFDAANTGVTASNFTLTGAAATGATVGTPTTANAGLTWNIPVTTGSTDGTLTLNLANATGTTPGVSTTLPFAGQSYTMDKTVPTVTSVVRLTPTGQSTNLTSVTFRVTYSEPVTLTAPETARYSVVAVSGSSIVGTVTGVTGSGNTRDVTANISSGSGEFRLRVNN